MTTCPKDHRRPWVGRFVRTSSRPGRSQRSCGSRNLAEPLSTSESQPEAHKQTDGAPSHGLVPFSEDGQRETHSQLYLDVLQKVSVIFGKHLKDVLDRHRRVETLTGEKNVIGRQNLVEALAHLGILFARAPELDRDKQLEQVAFLGDHLRRVMMESFELEVYVTIADAWDEKSPNSIGRRYEALAAPLIRQKKLLGHITPEEVQERFDALTDDIVQARRAKIADGDWMAWTEAADDLEEAAKKMKGLKREMGAAVDAASSRRYDRKLMLAGVLFSAALGVGLTLAIQAIA